MAAMKGKGTQKEARLERLKAEIATYIEDRPGCSAADIVAYLSNERKMRNHGLTARKIGYFIPRHMKNSICLLYTSPSPRDRSLSRMPSSA